MSDEDLAFSRLQAHAAGTMKYIPDAHPAAGKIANDKAEARRDKAEARREKADKKKYDNNPKYQEKVKTAAEKFKVSNRAGIKEHEHPYWGGDK